jgi:LAO/AO transport system kinase
MSENKKDNKHNKHKNALSVSKGIEKPPSVNPGGPGAFQNRRKNRITPAVFTEKILNRDISYLSRAITLIESSLEEHQDLASELVESCLPFSGNSIRVGITGSPGVGKSTFIERFGSMLTAGGSRIAVLAVDPSSRLTRGSILGDKTRMERLSADPNAFIRPSPSGGSLGGVAFRTRESIILCEAAGFDTILIETVGVGQSETAVRSMVDFFLLLLLAGAGDELQGIKRGIMEMADGLVITKADGNNAERAGIARSHYENARRFFPAGSSGWKPCVQTCSAITGAGMEEIYENITKYKDMTSQSGFFFSNRREQSLYWMHENIERQLVDGFYNDPIISRELGKIRNDVTGGNISGYKAARGLLKKYLKRPD